MEITPTQALQTKRGSEFVGGLDPGLDPPCCGGHTPFMKKHALKKGVKNQEQKNQPPTHTLGVSPSPWAPQRLSVCTGLNRRLRGGQRNSRPQIQPPITQPDAFQKNHQPTKHQENKSLSQRQ